MRPTSGNVIQLERDKPRNRCRKWELRANFGRVDGKYPKRTRRFDGTWREANAALAQWIAELELEDTAESATPQTFAGYADMWHGRRARSGLYAKRTIDREVGKLAAAKMHLGEKRMDDIGQSDIEDMLSALVRGDSPSGKPLAEWTVKSVSQVVAKLFHDAVRDGHVEADPTRGVRVKKVPQVERCVPSTSRVDAMLAGMDMRDKHCMAVMLCACCGLRRSEAVMLTCDDWDGSRVHVTKAAEDDGSPKPTKSVMIREVPAPRVAAELLDAWCCDHSGKICDMTPHALTVWWQRHRGLWGMDGVRLHDLRHAYATRLAEAGVHPSVMQKLGGWSSINVCMNIYTHVHSSSLDDAVRRAFA